MTASMQKAPEMEAANEQTPESNEPQTSESGTADSTENAATELELPGWSIVTFEGVAMSGLTYEEARNWLDKLNEQKISGLCIVTDEAAARIGKGRKQ